MIEAGVKGKQELVVEYKDTAAVHGSGALEVFGTPALVALMEKTAQMSVKELLPETEGTVGTMVMVKHLGSSGIGSTIRCESELVKVDGKKLLFKLQAFDEAGLIGEGEHERFIINNEKFLKKVSEKLNNK